MQRWPPRNHCSTGIRKSISSSGSSGIKANNQLGQEESVAGWGVSLLHAPHLRETTVAFPDELGLLMIPGRCHGRQLCRWFYPRTPVTPVVLLHPSCWTNGSKIIFFQPEEGCPFLPSSGVPRWYGKTDAHRHSQTTPLLSFLFLLMLPRPQSFCVSLSLSQLVFTLPRVGLRKPPSLL